MSSDDNLVGIFRLIESSEQVVEDKKKLLFSLKSQNEDSLTKIFAIQERNGQITEKLDGMKMELSSLEQKFKFLDRQCSFFENQNQHLSESIENEEGRLETIERDMARNRKVFMEASKVFVDKYDVCGKFLTKKKLEANHKLTEICSQINEVVNEINVVEEKINEHICNEKKLEELRESYLCTIEETKKLENLEKGVSNFPNNDPDCKRMDEELTIFREQNFKGQCQNLSRDLKCLENQYLMLQSSSYL